MRRIIKKALLIWEQRVYRRILSRGIKANKVAGELTGYKTAMRIYEKWFFGR